MDTKREGGARECIDLTLYSYKLHNCTVHLNISMFYRQASKPLIPIETLCILLHSSPLSVIIFIYLVIKTFVGPRNYKVGHLVDIMLSGKGSCQIHT